LYTEEGFAFHSVAVDCIALTYCLLRQAQEKDGNSGY